MAKHKNNSRSKFIVQTTGILFILYSKYTEWFAMKYAGPHTMFPLFVQRVRKGHHWIFECQVTRLSWHPQPIMPAAPVPNINVLCSVLQGLRKDGCIPELENFNFWRLRLRRFFIRQLSDARFGYPEGGLDKTKEYKKLLNFFYVKLWTRSPAARCQGGELDNFGDFDIISSIVVGVCQTKKSIF